MDEDADFDALDEDEREAILEQRRAEDRADAWIDRCDMVGVEP